jgi:hypothetical protein
MVSCKNLRGAEDIGINIALLFKMNINFSEVSFMNPRVSIHISNEDMI